MAGHSQFKNIMHRKGAQDAKRAQKFAKLGREIYVAAKAGLPDPTMNAKLRGAITAARSEGMPKDRIEAAVKKAAGGGTGENYEEMRYEGYGPGGVAVIVEALTDNRNRSAADIRSAFTKHGGTMGETGSVNFMFQRVGLITYPKDRASEEGIFEAALEAGAENCETDAEQHTVTCATDDINEVRDALTKKFGDPRSAKAEWLPLNTTAINEDQARSLMKMIEVLEEHDDVQTVFTNFEITDEVMKKMAAE